MILLAVVSIITRGGFFYFNFLNREGTQCVVLLSNCESQLLHSQLQIQGRERAGEKLFLNKNKYRKSRLKRHYLPFPYK